MDPNPTSFDLQKQQNSIRSMFNLIAHRYDILNRILSLGIDRIWRRATVRRIKPSKNDLILDLASGTGDLAKEALRQGAGFVVGVDPARNMLLHAKKKMSQDQYQCFESFGEKLPFQNQMFQHAMVAYGIRNVTNRNTVFKEVYRVLKPGGTFALLEFSKSKNTLFSWLFRLYFFRVLPRVGGWISGHYHAYKYLPHSVDQFIAPKDLAKEASQVGFKTKGIFSWFFGVTTLLWLEKPLF